MLSGKKIIVGISGGIAAYKTISLIRLLIKEGAEIKVVVTRNALEFITKLTLETVSKNKVYVDVFESPDVYTTEHISLTDWGDIFVVAPATANIIGKYANGLADDALSTSLLAFDKTVFIAPAMNTKMFENSSVQKNIEYLRSNGVSFIEPTEGILACNVEGKGRMEEPENIVKIITSSFKKKRQFSGKTVLVSAGPTYEAIDPVRFIGNNSSGLMGFSIVEEIANRGAEVELVVGPTHLQINHPSVKRTDVVSSEDMYNACMENFPHADITIMTAAVSDYTPQEVASEKIKKTKNDCSINLKPTKDILGELGANKKEGQVLVGFALETNNEIEYAKEKLHNKNLDFVVINSLNDKGAGFKHKTNKITIIDKSENVYNYDLKLKSEVAKDIVDKIYELIKS